MLVGVLAALIATLAPVESPVPLGPLEGLTGSAPAKAQPSTVGPGTPDPCTAPWQEDPDDASLCLLSQPACAEHPLQPGSYLVLSTEFPDFCEEEVVRDPLDPAPYTACTALTGYVIKTFARGTDQVCRMIRPTQCASNLHRMGVNTCRQVQRRTWSCTLGTPTNRFNTCYQQPPDYTTSGHPACGPGAPSFSISSCEDYVGQDFVRASDLPSVPCGSFATDDSRSALQTLISPANAYWCQFDSSYLDVDCYGAVPTCTPSNAVCIKRASTTGGCYAIANALRCRKWQADYQGGSATAEDVYLEGCAPCVVLPFSPVPPECPQDLSAGPSQATEPASVSRFRAIHQLRDDTTEGSARTLCQDPPRGRLVWDSSHHTRLAVVNSPVVLRVSDIPDATRTIEYFAVRYRGQPLFVRTTAEHFEYPDSAPGDPLIRAWPTFDDVPYARVDMIVGGEYTRFGTYRTSGVCFIHRRPDFRLRVEELWPDNDAADIRALFGANALDWWTALNPTQQRDRTEARGLNYVVGMNATELQRELTRRADTLTQEVRCNYGDDVWCRWRPTRSGYYRLVAAGAWYMWKHTFKRSWVWGPGLQRFDQALMNASAIDGDCPMDAGNQWRSTDLDCLSDDLISMGYVDGVGNLDPAAAGLQPDLRGTLPLPPGTYEERAEFLFTAAAGPDVACPPRDIRVTCGGVSASRNYTETEPIGILVHEVRVSTVTPER